MQANQDGLKIFNKPINLVLDELAEKNIPFELNQEDGTLTVDGVTYELTLLLGSDGPVLFILDDISIKTQEKN
ncbi:MAG: hypothetical protein NZ519_05100 [Bacteroidia bacterium]|nr:hypothetical protein [Bacteroidia bacterium]